MFSKILLIMLSLFFIFGLYSLIKQRPELFSVDKINKGFFSMGILALILIAVIGVVVVLLRH